MNGLTNFEKDALKLLLEGNIKVLWNLRKQFETCNLVNRTFSGMGFFIEFETNFQIENKALKGKTFQLSDVIAEVEGLEHGVGFVLFIENGKLSAFEEFTYDCEDWPNEIYNYKLSYLDGKKRNIKSLQNLWK